MSAANAGLIEDADSISYGAAQEKVTISKLNEKVHKVQGVVKSNVRKVHDRGEQLQELLIKADNLHEGGIELEKTSYKVKKKKQRQHAKLWLILMLIVIIIIVVLVLIAGAIAAGLCFTTVVSLPCNRS